MLVEIAPLTDGFLGIKVRHSDAVAGLSVSEAEMGLIAGLTGDQVLHLFRPFAIQIRMVRCSR